MNQFIFDNVEKYMLDCTKDSAHDKEHIYRVLYFALSIAKFEKTVDIDVLISACLLHDIGRVEQFENPNLCHANIGSIKAYNYLINHNWSLEKAEHIRDCIFTHRYRNENLPASIEAKILFDSDKLDATGTLGIARTLLYKGQVSQPLYSLDQDGNVLDGTNDENPSFFQEYKYKLENIYDKFFTKRGNEIARERQISATSFYNSMLTEVKYCYENGLEELFEVLK